MGGGGEGYEERGGGGGGGADIRHEGRALDTQTSWDKEDLAQYAVGELVAERDSRY